MMSRIGKLSAFGIVCELEENQSGPVDRSVSHRAGNLCIAKEVGVYARLRTPEAISA